MFTISPVENVTLYAVIDCAVHPAYTVVFDVIGDDHTYTVVRDWSENHPLNT